MVDPDKAAASATAGRSDVCEEIGRAVGAVWQDFAGSRPASVNTEFVGDVVRCTIEEGAPEGDEAVAARSEPTGGITYRNQAQAAVARLTGRTVVGFIAKPPKGGAPITNAFILEAIIRKY